MIKRLYSVYDKCSDSYSDIYNFVNDAVGIRWFKEFLRSSPKSTRSDFKLIAVGTFDCASGECVSIQIGNTVVFDGKDFTDEV